MTVKIDVGADTSGVQSELNKVNQGVDRVEKTVADLGQTAQKTGRNLEQIGQAIDHAVRSTERLLKVQEALSKELGRQVTQPEAAKILDSYDSVRNDSRLGGRKQINQFLLEDLLTQPFNMDPARVRAYRRRTMELVTQRAGVGGYTTPAPEPVPAPSPAPGQGGGGGGGGTPPGRFDAFRKAGKQAASSAMSFGRGMLALAGVTSVMGMAGRAMDMANEESIGADTIKRILGDVGVDFLHLRDGLRMATDGLGINYVEAVRLAQAQAKLANITDSGALAAAVKTNTGFARSFGLDPNTAGSFFGIEREFHVTKSDQDSRRLALMIAEAVNKGGVVAKTEEVLQAVSNFTQMAARFTLTAPNIEGYTAALAGLTKTGLPGLDPTGAAGLLNRADQTVRQGGGMGEASMNFSYGAINRYMPGVNPVVAQTIWQDGLFGSAAHALGKGTAVGDYLRLNHVHLGHLSSRTNLQMQMELINRQYRNPLLRLDAIRNQFGLQSNEQAAALATMRPEKINTMAGILSRQGIDLKNVNMAGLQNLGAIAAAGHDRGKLTSLYTAMRKRDDINGADKDRLKAAFESGDNGKLQDAMSKVSAKLNQEDTPGKQTRQAIVDLNNSLDRIGAQLQPLINSIKNDVSRIANVIAPEDPKEANKAFSDRVKDKVAKLNSRLPPWAQAILPTVQDTIGTLEKGVDVPLAKGGKFVHDLLHPDIPYMKSGDMQALGRFGLDKSYDAILRQVAGGNPAKYRFMRNILNIEQRGHLVKPGYHAATSSAGAMGDFQQTPAFMHDYNVKNTGFQEQAKGLARYYEAAQKLLHGNRLAMYAGYNGGLKGGGLAVANGRRWAGETMNYTGMAAALEGVGPEYKAYAENAKGAPVQTAMPVTPKPQGDPLDALVRKRHQAAQRVEVHSHVHVPDIYVRHPDGTTQTVTPNVGNPVPWGAPSYDWRAS